MWRGFGTLPAGGLPGVVDQLSDPTPLTDATVAVFYAAQPVADRAAPRAATAVLHAFGFGHFKFFEIAKLARDKHGKCDTNLNHPPVSFFAKVTASGKATIGKH